MNPHPHPHAEPERPCRAGLRLVHTRGDLAGARDALPGRVAVVPTMGALHAGHRANLRKARAAADSVIATVFVNPLQFGPGEDLDRYPRTLDADVALCEEEGVDVVFAPVESELYPNGRDGLTTVHAGPGGDLLEGAWRPGFFTGVLTVVAKLFHLTRPDAAYFGEKDFQQLAMVRRMVRDLDLGVEIVAVATVREDDGLALSSRNVYLSETERAAALAIPHALRTAQDSPDPLATAEKILAAEPGLAVDYVALRGEDLGEAPETGPARLLIAAKAGTTRLIDNAQVVIKPSTIGDPDA